MLNSLTDFIYGMTVMFYSMMAWMFWRKGDGRLPRLIMWLMIVLVAECVKDLLFWQVNEASENWYLVSACDMVIIPIYSFVLMELVKPGWTSWRKLALHELPYVALPLLFAFTGDHLWFTLLVVWGAIYGSATLVIMFFYISQYHKQLKERFSYQENINLNWLRGILVSFFGILVIWVLGCFCESIDFDNFYMGCSLVAWMIISYFVYRHENVMDELVDNDNVPVMEDEASQELTGLAARVKKLFMEDKVYLNPKLKLSDVATMVGTNRTYLSRYFNQDNGQTFYDYVNNLRIHYAMELLKTTSAPLGDVAEKSGFNSLSTFRRVFYNNFGCSPTQFRAQQ